MNNEDLLTELRWALDNIGASRDYFRIGNALESAIKALLAPSATAAPVAWMYEENGERMFGHPDGYRPLGAVPLYAGSPPVEEGTIKDAERYRWLRSNHPIHDSSPFICRNFSAHFSQWTGEDADKAVDDAMRCDMKGGPGECGYDRTASLNAGHYVCTCGGGINRHYDAGGLPK